MSCPAGQPSRRRKLYRNPIVLALEWQRRIDAGEVPSKTALARQLGFTGAHVIQVLRLLTLAPAVIEQVLALGDPMEGRVLGAHSLRALTKLPPHEQEAQFRMLLRKRGRG